MTCETAQDYQEMANIAMSLCIPRVSSTVKRDYIQQVFDKFGFGKISKIDMVCKKMEKHQRVFIHFQTWNNSARAIRAKEILDSGKDIKIVYDSCWFWKVSLNRCNSSRV
jgi:DNA helicase IV